ncbi:MAG: hypothetical protein K9G62_02360 [Alphaproteobacteria bacterium]|nr:hypothetical protein [Alphaproteobacteria bacterium]
MKKLFLFLSAGLLTAGSSASAVEPLIFGQILSAREAQLVGDFYTAQQKNAPDPAGIARADLNGDAIDEFIIRDSQCRTDGKSPCLFDILAETRKGILSLGQIRAQRLIASDASTGGVRAILAFENPMNDYEFQTYAWNTEENRYVLQPPKSVGVAR